MECGLSTTFNTIEEAEDMFADLLGCITLRYTSSTLGELCQEHVEEVSNYQMTKQGESWKRFRCFLLVVGVFLCLLTCAGHCVGGVLSQVGMDEILKCVGIATDLCGVPELTDDAKKAMKSPEGVDMTSLIPDQVRPLS